MASPQSGRFPLAQDLSPLVAALRAQGVNHRITEIDGEQVLLLAEGSDQQLVAQLLAAFESGELTSAMTTAPVKLPHSGIEHLRKAPVTLALVCVGVFGTLAIEFRWHWVVEALFFASSPEQNILDSVLRGYTLPWESHQWWRILTPAFIHFSWLHILFNAGAMLQVGSWLERYWGAGKYVTLCLLIGIGSNLAQYLETPSPNFGGLSGIVFGLFAFNGVIQLRAKSFAVSLPRGLYVMLTVWLIAGFTPVFHWLFGVHVANGAHLGGALLGAAIALIIRLPVERQPNIPEAHT